MFTPDKLSSQSINSSLPSLHMHICNWFLLLVPVLLPFPSNHWSVFCHYGLELHFLEFYSNEIIQYALLCVWLLSHSIIVSRLTQAASHINSSLPLILSIVPFYGYNRFCCLLSVHKLMGICVVHSLWLLQIKLPECTKSCYNICFQLSVVILRKGMAGSNDRYICLTF